MAAKSQVRGDDPGGCSGGHAVSGGCCHRLVLPCKRVDCGWRKSCHARGLYFGLRMSGHKRGLH